MTEHKRLETWWGEQPEEQRDRLLGLSTGDELPDSAVLSAERPRAVGMRRLPTEDPGRGRWVVQKRLGKFLARQRKPQE